MTTLVPWHSRAVSGRHAQLSEDNGLLWMRRTACMDQQVVEGGI